MDALLTKYTPIPGSGLVIHMLGFFRKSKVWYEQKMNEPGSHRKRGMDTSFVDILPTILSRCIDFWGEEEGRGRSRRFMGRDRDKVGGMFGWRWRGMGYWMKQALDAPLLETLPGGM
jgi:hypothetical protein